MEAFWIAAALILGGLAIVQAVLVAAQSHEHRRFVHSRLAELEECHPSGRAILFVPCRGRDVGLDDNLASLFSQDYDDYEIRFLVETPSDPACGVIGRVAAEYPQRVSRIVFTGKATDCGQKVHNLLRGTERLPAEVEYLAFADSDARLRPHWLRALVYRLRREEVGAVTGYRWFVPMRATPANLLATSANAGIGMLLGRGNPNLVWGGSWAVRRDRFEQLGIRRAWHGKLNDDLVVTGIVRRAGLRVEYEPACAVASPLDMRVAEMFDFARRQYLQARFYLPRFWLGGLLLATFVLAALLGSIAAAVSLWLAGSVAAWPAAATAGVLYASWVYRGVYRVRLSAELFPEYQDRLWTVRLLDLFGGPATAVVNWLIFASTAFGQTLVWRDIHYRLDSEGNVLSVRHKEGLSLEAAAPALSGSEDCAAVEATPPRADCS
jgi:ceramide glucosyltransferase